MSRNFMKISDTETLVAGYDRMLGNYFVQKYDHSSSGPDTTEEVDLADMDLDPADPEAIYNEDPELIYSICTDFRAQLKDHPDFPDRKFWDQHQLADLIRKEGGPEVWAQAIHFAEPF